MLALRSIARARKSAGIGRRVVAIVVFGINVKNSAAFLRDTRAYPHCGHLSRPPVRPALTGCFAVRIRKAHFTGQRGGFVRQIELERTRLSG
jgi:hypothetical protein